MLAFVALASTFAVPVVAVIASFIWAIWLRKRPGAPPFAARAGFGLAGVAAVTLIVGFVVAARAFGQVDAADPSGKARALAEGISEAMNAGAFGGLLALAALAWLLVFTLRARKRRAK